MTGSVSRWALSVSLAILPMACTEPELPDQPTLPTQGAIATDGEVASVAAELEPPLAPPIPGVLYGWHPDVDLPLGAGVFLTRFDDPRITCLKFKPTNIYKFEDNSSPWGPARLRVNFTRDFQQMERIVGIDERLTASYLKSKVEVTRNLDASEKLTTENVYIVLRFTADAGPIGLHFEGGPTLHDQPEALVNKRDFESFYDRCGTHFISAIRRGSSLSAVLVVRDSESKLWRKLQEKREAIGRVGDFGIDFVQEVEDDLKKARRQRELVGFVVSSGGDPSGLDGYVNRVFDGEKPFESIGVALSSWFNGLEGAKPVWPVGFRIESYHHYFGTPLPNSERFENYVRIARTHRRVTAYVEALTAFQAFIGEQNAQDLFPHSTEAMSAAINGGRRALRALEADWATCRSGLEASCALRPVRTPIAIEARTADIGTVNENGEPHPTGLRVGKGDLLVFSPKRFWKERKGGDKTLKTRAVCGWKGLVPLNCEQHDIGMTSLYDTESSRDQLVGHIQALRRGLTLLIQWATQDGQIHQVGCPLEELRYAGSGADIVIRLEPRERCPEFEVLGQASWPPSDARSAPKALIANSVQMPQESYNGGCEEFIKIGDVDTGGRQACRDTVGIVARNFNPRVRLEMTASVWRLEAQTEDKLDAGDLVDINGFDEALGAAPHLEEVGELSTVGLTADALMNAPKSCTECNDKCVDHWMIDCIDACHGEHPMCYALCQKGYNDCIDDCDCD